MKLFYTNSSAKEEIGNLETRIATLEADATASASDIARLTEELKTANESVATLTTERDEAAKAFEASEAAEKSAKAELVTANAKLATFDTEVENAAQAKFAGLGGSMIPSSGKENEENNTLTRAAFAAMTPHAKAEHLRNGGKLTD